MFCIQDNQYVSPAVPGTAEKLNEILDSPKVKWKITTIRAVREPGAIKLWASNSDFQKYCLKEAGKKKVGEAFQALTDEEKLMRWATSLKESLPPLIFGARDFDEMPLKKDPTKTMKRRVLAGIHLSGLFMFDVDHVELVCKAHIDGNIADNQIELAKTLGVKADASCIDASRISYAPMREDIYYLNEEELLNYYNEEFDKKYCEAYRNGKTEPIIHKEGFDGGDDSEPVSGEPVTATTECPDTYHGVSYKKICEAWQEAQGGTPAVGDRHRTMLQLALDLRYICDNDPEVVFRTLGLCGFVQDVIRERGEQEVRGVADTACGRQLYREIPKRMRQVLESAGVHDLDGGTAGRPVAAVDIPYEQFAQRLEPLLSAPYAEACRGVSRQNWIGAVFASGAMYCTLMTRCWYESSDILPRVSRLPRSWTTRSCVRCVRRTRRSGRRRHATSRNRRSAGHRRRRRSRTR